MAESGDSPRGVERKRDKLIEIGYALASFLSAILALLIVLGTANLMRSFDFQDWSGLDFLVGDERNEQATRVIEAAVSTSLYFVFIGLLGAIRGWREWAKDTGDRLAQVTAIAIVAGLLVTPPSPIPSNVGFEPTPDFWTALESKLRALPARPTQTEITAAIDAAKLHVVDVVPPAPDPRVAAVLGMLHDDLAALKTAVDNGNTSLAALANIDSNVGHLREAARPLESLADATQQLRNASTQIEGLKSSLEATQLLVTYLACVDGVRAAASSWGLVVGNGDKIEACKRDLETARAASAGPQKEANASK